MFSIQLLDVKMCTMMHMSLLALLSSTPLEKKIKKVTSARALTEADLSVMTVVKTAWMLGYCGLSSSPSCTASRLRQIAARTTSSLFPFLTQRNNESDTVSFLDNAEASKLQHFQTYIHTLQRRENSYYSPHIHMHLQPYFVT